MSIRNKIKVLNILTTIEDGGLEMLVHNIYHGLDENVYDLNVCTLLPYKDTFISQGFKRICSETYHLNFVNKNIGFKGFFENLIGVFSLARLLHKNNYDIIHSHEFFAPFVTRISVIINKILHPTKKPIIFVTYHNIYSWLKPVHHITNRFLSIFTKKIVCVSHSVLMDSIQKEKIPRNKFEVIYNGMNPDNFYPDGNLRNKERLELGYKKTDFVIGNVGAISVRKGQIYLLKAFNNIKNDFPNLKILLVGSPRKHELYVYDEMLDYIKKNNLTDFVKIHNTTPKINAIYNSLDLFVMSSVTEGFGLSAFEAMLTEKICIFSDIPVYKEIIIEGETGFFFKSKNSNSLAEVLTKVLNNIPNYEELKGFGRRYVMENFTLTRMVEKYDRLYKGVNVDN